MPDRAEDVAHVVVNERFLVSKAELVTVNQHTLCLEPFSVHLWSVLNGVCTTHKSAITALQVLDPNLRLRLALFQLLDDGRLRRRIPVRRMQSESDDGVPVRYALLL